MAVRALKNPEYVLWNRQDQLILSWLLASMTETIQAQMVGCNTAADVWKVVYNLRITVTSEGYAIQIAVSNTEEGRIEHERVPPENDSF